MTEDQLTQLFNHIQKEFDLIRIGLEKMASEEGLDKLANTVDSFVKRLDDSETEQTARDAQFERLLEWAREVSKKTGVPLKNL